MASLEQSRNEAKNSLTQVQQRIEELNTLIEEDKKQIIDTLNDRATIKSKMSSFDTMMEQLRIRKAELNSRLLRAKSDEAERDAEIQSLEEEFRKMFGSSFEEILPENPLLDSFELTLTSASSDKELLDSFIAAAGRIEGVDRVSYPALMAERLHATVNKIRLVLLLFGGALLVISLILLSNTIRLAIFSKRYLINTMKLVGATKWFIMRPFLGSSLTQGILAGTAASALFGLAVYGLNEAVPELMTIAEAGKIAIILGSMIAGGIIISGLFTFAALNKFINMKSNKIYLY